MLTNDIARRMGGLALLGGFALGAGACGDTVGPPGEGEGHVRPSTVRLSLDGEELASASFGDSVGAIRVQPGQQTETIAVEFVDGDGDPVRLSDFFFLEVDVGDESIALFEQDSPGEFSGRARGVAEGETGMKFKLMHGVVGDGSHVDFEPAAIPVIVAAPGG